MKKKKQKKIVKGKDVEIIRLIESEPFLVSKTDKFNFKIDFRPENKK